MTEQQNRVVATTVAGLFLVTVFLCPWRVQPSDEIRWSPIYQPPLSYDRSFDDEISDRGRSRIEEEDAELAVGLLAGQVLAIGVVGGVLYRLSAGSSRSDGSSSDAE